MHSLQDVAGNPPTLDENETAEPCAEQKMNCKLKSAQNSTEKSWGFGDMHPVLRGRLSFAEHVDTDDTRDRIKRDPHLYFFSSHLPEMYHPFCLDFGPVNLNIIHRFCSLIRSRVKDERLKRRKLVYYVVGDSAVRTNSVFLLGCYLMIDHNYSPEAAMAPFDFFSKSALLRFRDATFQDPDYEIDILDCFRGLHKAMSCQWYTPGSFDLQQFEKWDNPTGGDLHQINHKFLAFKGPVAEEVVEADESSTKHAPSHYHKFFAHQRVTAVVRLNGAHYAPDAFESHGFRHYDLFFEDCTVPTVDIIEHFLDVCDKEGVVAVHCFAGLGRTGTLIALWMMKHYAFSANEAIAWLRIVRPGSVIGPQQHFLKQVESMVWEGNRLRPPAAKVLSRLILPNELHEKRGPASEKPPATKSTALVHHDSVSNIRHRSKALLTFDGTPRAKAAGPAVDAAILANHVTEAVSRRAVTRMACSAQQRLPAMFSPPQRTRH